MPETKAELLLDVHLDLGESPFWHPIRHRLGFVDIHAKCLHEYDPASGEHETFLAPEKIGCAAPADGDGFVLALESGAWTLSPDGSDFQPLQLLPESDRRGRRFNDGKCDPQGRFWAGTMSLSGEYGAGALYCFNSRQPARKVLSEVSVSNGLSWSVDGRTLYFIDSRLRRVDALNFESETGALTQRRTVIEFGRDHGIPDGCATDADGMLWIAHWQGYCVGRWNPADGSLLQKVQLPVPHVTSCAFGGKSGDMLFVTTARSGLSSDDLRAYPHSGGVFACQVGVVGGPTEMFSTK